MTAVRFLLLVLGKFVRSLPNSVLVTTGSALGWFLHRAIRFRYSVVRRQFDVVFGAEFDDSNKKRLIAEFYRHIGLVVLELLQLPGINRSTFGRRFVYHGEEHLKQALSKGKGAIVLCGHVGNWEYMGLGWALRGYSVGAIVKEMKSELGNVFTDVIHANFSYRLFISHTENLFFNVFLSFNWLFYLILIVPWAVSITATGSASADPATIQPKIIKVNNNDAIFCMQPPKMLKMVYSGTIELQAVRELRSR